MRLTTQPKEGKIKGSPITVLLQLLVLAHEFALPQNEVICPEGHWLPLELRASLPHFGNGRWIRGVFQAVGYDEVAVVVMGIGGQKTK